MIVENNLHFTLQTARSSYVFRVDEKPTISSISTTDRGSLQRISIMRYTTSIRSRCPPKPPLMRSILPTPSTISALKPALPERESTGRPPWSFVILTVQSPTISGTRITES